MSLLCLIFSFLAIIAQDTLSPTHEEYNKIVAVNPNLSLVEQLNDENCSYVFSDEIDMKGQTVRCPRNSRLVFKGGRLVNGELSGNKAVIEGFGCLGLSMVLSGSWVEPKLEWYILDKNGETPVDAAFDNIVNLADSIVIPYGKYLLEKSITVSHSCVIEGNGSTLLSSTVDALAAMAVGADSVRVNNLKIECDNKARKYIGRIHGLVIDGNYFRGKGIMVTNSNQNGFDIRGTGCVLENCISINPGYAGFRSLNVLKNKMEKEDAWCTLYGCQAIGYKRKGFVNNGGMGILTIKGFTAIPLNDSSEAAILLESNENSHNYEAYISDVEALGIPGNVVKQKAFERAVYTNCNFESKYGAVFRFHPHRNTKNGERNAYIEIDNCKLKGCTYCINGNADIQSLKTQDTLYIHHSELTQTSGNSVIDVIKNVVIISKSTLHSSGSNNKAVIVRSPNVISVSIEDCIVSTTKVFGYSDKGQNVFGEGVFQLKNTVYSGKLFGIRKFDSLVKLVD